MSADLQHPASIVEPHTEEDKPRWWARYDEHDRLQGAIAVYCAITASPGALGDLLSARMVVGNGITSSADNRDGPCVARVIIRRRDVGHRRNCPKVVLGRRGITDRRSALCD